MVTKPTGRPRGRPSSYDEVTADIICEQLAQGAALYRICQLPSFPDIQTVYRWLENNPDFRTKYAQARAIQQDVAADEIIDIAGRNIDPAQARNMIDARKWRASKLAPSKYGDKTDVNISGSISIPEEQLDARITELLRKGGTIPALAGPRTIEAEE
jgi:hypothetical protein